MKLPRLLVIADGFTNPEVGAKARQAVQLGIRWIQLRDHKASSDAFDQVAMEIIRDVEEINRDALVTINSRIGIAELHNLHFHTTRHGPSMFESKLVLGQTTPIGISVHNGKELADAYRAQAQYVIFSPIFGTKSHPEVRAVGLDVLKKACYHARPMPVIAMGGITPQNCVSCLHMGAHGVAVHSAIMSAPSMMDVINDFKQVIPGL